MIREFHSQQSRKDKVLVWKVWVVEDAVYSEWGELGGQMQTTKETPGTKGKSNTKSFVSANEQAIILMDRLIRKKKEQGYVELVDGEYQGESTNQIDFSKKLPKNLCFPKPLQNMDKCKLSLEEMLISIKRDGMCVIACKHEDGVIRLYSRRMDEVTDLLPHIVDDLEKLTLPNCSILLGEIVAGADKDNFKYVSEIMRCSPDKAVSRQEENGRLYYYLFDMPYFAGECLYNTTTFPKRFLKLSFAVDDDICRYLTCVEFLIENPKQVAWDSFVKALDIEGFVIYDRHTLNNGAISFDGKASRPNVCWKYKPVYSLDVRVVECKGGTGKNRERLGKVRVEHNGTDYGWVGGGFKDDERDQWSNNELMDQIIEVEYSGLTEAGKFIFPRFKRVRWDYDEEV